MIYSRLVAFLSALCLTVFFYASGHASEADQEDKLKTLGAAHLGATIAGLVAVDGLSGIIAEAAALVTNLALKEEQAALTAPADFSMEPNSGDMCTYGFDMPRTHHLYSSFFGIETSPIPATWGELGAPDVYHWGTDVVVSANSPHIVPGFLVGNANLPAGKNTIDWQAGTVRDEVFDVALPTIMLLSTIWSEMKGSSAVEDLGSNADEAAKRAKLLRSQKRFDKASAFIYNGTATLLGLPVRGSRKDFAIYLADELTNFEVIRTTKTREQVVTVFDRRPPVISVHQPTMTFEATDIGGVLKRRIFDELQASASATDPCDRAVGFGNDAPDLLRIGSNTITWRAVDGGPTDAAGSRNETTATQTVIVEDTQAPIMVPPAGRVIEVDPSGPDGSGLDVADVSLGSPRVVDLADPSPVVTSNAPAFFPVDSRTSVDWSATDSSNNASQAEQLITVKTLGTNTAPSVVNVSTSTLTSQPVDILLSGTDPDLLDSRFDPLAFSIPDRPDNGEFIAPLLPYFIEDYRSAVEGPYGEGFATTGNPPNWIYDNACPGVLTNWVYRPRFVHVMDDGTYFMIDSFWRCGASDATTRARISKWTGDGELTGQIDYNGTTDAFVVDQDGLLYTISRGSGTLTLSQVRPGFEVPGLDFLGDAWRFDNASMVNPALGLNDNPSENQYSYARVDSKRGLLYITDRRLLFVFDVRPDAVDGVDVFNLNMGPRYLGNLTNNVQFLCNTGSYSSSWSGFAIEVDAEGNLFVTDSCDDRIHRFEPTYFDETGTLVKGAYVGWMGRCDTSTNNACDTVKQRSKGYACTDATCSVAVTDGEEKGQFDRPVYVSLDPNDILYVADRGRVQRFATDGSFAGEAKSTGTGINQGEVPGFVLGNLGDVKAVSVNSSQFFVVDQLESFIHVFETTPLKDITDSSATVTYVSDFNFHSNTDTFTYRASDGLANSNLGTVSIQVARNFRPPVAFPQLLELDEDDPLDIVLSGDDPDGVIGSGDVFPLDTLTFSIASQPEHGDLSGSNVNWTYTPDPDYFGEDTFTFVANDGLDDSAAASVNLTIQPLNDAPRVVNMRLPARTGAGFPVTLTARYSDDGDEEPHLAKVNWRSQQDVNGGFIDPDGSGDASPQLVGLLVQEPTDRTGTGAVLGQHTFSQLGSAPVEFCIDDLAGGNCEAQTLLVEHLVNLGIDTGTVSGSDETSGSFFDIDIDVRNEIPNGIAGLDATNVALDQIPVADLAVTAILQDPSGLCSISSGSLSCSDALMIPGETFTVRVRIMPTAPVIYNLDSAFAIDLDSSADMVQEVYTAVRWLTFLADTTDTDGDGMSDVFETAYGLKPGSGTDASLDPDGDRLTNLEEFHTRTNPNARDTDGDGVWDGDDYCPNNPEGSVDDGDVCGEAIPGSSILKIIKILVERNQE